MVVLPLTAKAFLFRRQIRRSIVSRFASLPVSRLLEARISEGILERETEDSQYIDIGRLQQQPPEPP